MPIYEFICPQCKKLTFVHRAPSRRIPKYCSAKCARLSQRTILPKTCSVCGKEFRPKNFAPSKYTTYCSRKCSRVPLTKKDKPNKATKCEFCGKTFSYYHIPCEPLRKYCSPKCYKAYRKSLELTPIECPVCGKLFKPFKKSLQQRQKTCSRRCYYIYQTTIWQNNPSGLESRFYFLLSSTGTNFIPQYYLFLSNMRMYIDAAILESKIAIELDGCFWHAHKCCVSTLNEWQLDRIKRDKAKGNILKKHGWTIFRFWECEFNANPTACIDQILDKLYPNSVVQLSFGF